MYKTLFSCVCGRIVDVVHVTWSVWWPVPVSMSPTGELVSPSSYQRPITDVFWGTCMYDSKIKSVSRISRFELLGSLVQDDSERLRLPLNDSSVTLRYSREFFDFNVYEESLWT